jgi:hypothetical protein
MGSPIVFDVWVFFASGEKGRVGRLYSTSRSPEKVHRALVKLSKRGKSAKRQINGDERSPVEKHAGIVEIGS